MRSGEGGATPQAESSPDHSLAPAGQGSPGLLPTALMLVILALVLALVVQDRQAQRRYESLQARFDNVMEGYQSQLGSRFLMRRMERENSELKSELMRLQAMAAVEASAPSSTGRSTTLESINPAPRRVTSSMHPGADVID